MGKKSKDRNTADRPKIRKAHQNRNNGDEIQRRYENTRSIHHRSEKSSHIKNGHCPFFFLKTIFRISILCPNSGPFLKNFSPPWTCARGGMLRSGSRDPPPWSGGADQLVSIVPISLTGNDCYN